MNLYFEQLVDLSERKVHQTYSKVLRRMKKKRRRRMKTTTMMTLCQKILPKKKLLNRLVSIEVELYEKAQQ